MKKPTQSMADMMMQSVAASQQPVVSATQSMPSTADDKLVAFGQRIKASHKEQLKRLAFWSRRNERLILERALTEFFARQDPELLRPIPEDE
jgi:hypothetical protein